MKRPISKKRYIVFLHEENRRLCQDITNMLAILKAILDDLESGNLISGDDAGATAEAAIEIIQAIMP